MPLYRFLPNAIHIVLSLRKVSNNTHMQDIFLLRGIDI